jgi:SH3-like domain-containing protein
MACHSGWCEIEVSGARGYVRQKQDWGVYPDENFGE